jgi:hypothetical protein
MSWSRRGVGRLCAGLTALLLVVGCTSPPTPAPPTPAPSPIPSPTPVRTPLLTPSATPVPSPPIPPGMAYVDIPEAGLRVPVPLGWRHATGDELADPGVREELVSTYPGAGRLLDASDEMGDRASIAFVAVDGSAPSLSGPLATNVSVFVSQPSVGGILLDLVAGFIIDAMGDTIGAKAPAERARVRLPAGEAIWFRHEGVGETGERLVAVGWVIGAPAGTILLTVTGVGTAMGALDTDGLGRAVVPISPR